MASILSRSQCVNRLLGADLRKHQSSASLVYVQEIHRWPMNSPHKWPVTLKKFPYDDVIIEIIRNFMLNKWHNYLLIRQESISWKL